MPPNKKSTEQRQKAFSQKHAVTATNFILNKKTTMRDLHLELQPNQDDSVASDDSSSSSDHDKSQSDSSTPNNNDDDDMEPKDMEREFAKGIIEKEEKHVRSVRYALAGAIITCAAIVSGCVYMLVHRSEQRSFKEEFMVYTSIVIENVQWEKNYNFALLRQLSSVVTSNAGAVSALFPNHTEPNFEIEAGYVNGLSGMIACVYAPFILDNEREQWEEYAMMNQGWINVSNHLRETHDEYRNPIKHTKDDENDHETAFQGEVGDSNGEMHDELEGKRGISNSIYHLVNGNVTPVPKHLSTMYSPIWQVTPPVPMAMNADLFSSQVFLDIYTSIIANHGAVLSSPAAVDPLFDFLFDSDHASKKQEPHSFLAEPVYTSLENYTIVGMVIGLAPFDNLLDFLFPEKTKGVICVLIDNCGTRITYEINGSTAKFLGYNDLHDPTYNSYKQTASLLLNETSSCSLEFHIYPSATLESYYTTDKPFLYASIVLMSFLITSVMIIVYDRTVTKRQEKTMRSALLNGSLVASLFPAIVRDRLLEDTRLLGEIKNRTKEGDTTELKNGHTFGTRPIADFFPNVTLMFADISGFTAWSSAREPFQVFELLETIYGAFDKLAKRRRIFKVETVGDCYVAVSGIPEARDDHAVAMAKYARDCLATMKSLTKILEVTLGPETSALAFRIGLHSGPVTGGVLRGDNARFQLFGDTVNTAARMESTGIPNRIQLSHATAALLVEAAKEHWIKPRDEVVYAKGKGEMKTYWLTVEDDRKSSRCTLSSRGSEITDLMVYQTPRQHCTHLDEKTQRLADWIVEILSSFLKLIVERRGSCAGIDLPEDHKTDVWEGVVDANVAVVDEVAEIISLPLFSMVFEDTADIAAIIPDEVEMQLRDYVNEIAMKYQKNAFHNFEHASHVTMSVTKLLGRIVRTECPGKPQSHSATSQGKSKAKALALHDHTYGITSDPISQFACIFAALIHDVDHYGIPNTQLVREQASVAVQFDGKSVLEQNSVVIAWNLLMEERFQGLRAILCTNRSEVKRFRQLVVNAVMATDIMAPDLKLIRNGRWNKAFAKNPPLEDPSDTINRKATIVIDHIIQASDVCHTMQHWHIYRKWNEQLFIEMTKAYCDGRADRDPADTWYQGEIGFFDNYIIPLAKKLAECGVFGVSSDEYLIYATKNRDEWVERGEGIVLEMKERIQK